MTRHMLLAILLAAGTALPAAADDTPATDMAQVSILPGWSTAQGGRVAGIRIDLAPGWKTYWRAPQGNGVPPEFDWSGSKNLASARVAFPAPETFLSYGRQTLGYHDGVTLPVTLEARDPTAPIHLDLSLFYGVCKEVCVPAEAHLTADLPATATGGEDRIRAALDALPVRGDKAGIAAHNCRIRPGDSADSYSLTARLRFTEPQPAPKAVVIESGREDVFITPRRITQAGPELTVDAAMDYYGEGALAFDRSGLRLTVFGPDGTVEIDGCPAG